MEDEKGVDHEEAQITGQTEGPYGTDDTDVDRPFIDNKHRPQEENSANGLDSEQVRGGQDGRNNRGIGSTDMDSQNGVLRTGDTDDGAPQVTQKGLDSAAAGGSKTSTAMVNVTTAGPDDDGSADQVGVPNAQEAAKHQNDTDETDQEDEAQKNREEEVAETGTDLTNQPAY